MIKYFILIVFVVMQFIFGQQQFIQSSVLPYPKIGWDSLSHKIFYPEIYRRANIQGAYLVELKIDTCGNALNAKIYELAFKKKEIDSTYYMSKDFLPTFTNEKWNPATNNGKKVESIISIPLVFILSQNGQVQPLIKYAEKPLVTVSY